MKNILITTIAAVLVVGCGNPEADSALLVAANKGNIEAVKQHLAAGADVNAKDRNGWTPLHWAAWGEKEIIELLISAGAEVNVKNKSGFTPLHYAAGNSQKDTVELLIAKGTNVNAKDNRGTTPLDRSITHNADDTEIADLLRKHGGKTAEELKAEGK